jgi:3-hydroxyacyl-CoA dehydrogenase/enoyl-CoA hydratase/3-hydroxybutyryl-CoA epimerase/enoyl-CoA isomerase
VFIVGADITEFPKVMEMPEAEMRSWLRKGVAAFGDLEKLPFPTVTAINGMALGGGFEVALATDIRVASEQARVGLPEVSLGICPGWGGTVRLSCVASLETTLAWAVTGKPQKAADALAAGAVDQVVSANTLRDAALNTLKQAVSGELDYMQARGKKLAFKSSSVSALAEFSQSDIDKLRSTFGAKLDSNYPAPEAILELVLSYASSSVDEAVKSEEDTFAKLVSGSVAKSLVGLFLSDQYLKSKAKGYAKTAHKVERAAVLGAGIMGGGICYQSAVTGTPVVMKDIRQEALELGMTTASGLLSKQVVRKRMDEAGMEQVLSNIKPVLEYDEFSAVDYVVEAVVENAKVKTAVLAEVETKVSPGTVLASNTSTISITSLAEGLSRPEQFCGMHFFNPVHAMPLVEIIRGEKTSESTVATAVTYGAAMGKTPIVVNDCPGFLVNRILFPYYNAFNHLLESGVSYERIDRVMEAFGWPMGPAYLADVIGLDTMVHADSVMQEGFPGRMQHSSGYLIETLVKNDLLGQKNGEGFYRYGKNDQARPTKEVSQKALELCKGFSEKAVDVSDQDIIDRLMIAMGFEAVRCLDDGIVEAPAEVDMGLILGLGFPRFRGGALRYLDAIGLDVAVSTAKKLSGLGALYTIPQGVSSRVAAGKRFY